MHLPSRIRSSVVGVGLLALAILAGLILWSAGSAQAERPLGELTQPALELERTAALDWTLQANPAADDAACRQCHADTDAVIEFPSGETLAAQVDLETLNGSAHGLHAGMPLACTDCHPAANYQIPHEPVEAPDLRAYELERSSTCERCHVQPHITSHPGPDSDTPVACTDCHGAHDVLTVEQWQDGEGTQACVDCHQSAGLDRFDQAELGQIVQNGLFAAEVTSEYCLACHSLPDFSLTFANGDELPLTIDAQAIHESVHGEDNPWQPLACTDCHEQDGFPHAPVEATGEREYNLNNYRRCEKCHVRFYERTLDSTHGTALAQGNEQAAVCTDCHGAHAVQDPDVPRQRISLTCGQCHTDIFDVYKDSVHGEALLDESNPDVPTCIECHGVHDISDPTTALARLRSPQLCAECHADEELMEQYDISTNVFETYVADFHGTTTTLFNAEDPTVEPNTAVCYDCHGVHDIRRPDDPESGIRANLLETCQQCHPDASEGFAASWTSHYEPSLENYPLVFLVNLFYMIVIPGTLGFFGFLVATDVYRRVRERLS